jgi:hypothetical protein
MIFWFDFHIPSKIWHQLFLNDSLFKRIQMILGIEKWFWKSNLGVFWQFMWKSGKVKSKKSISFWSMSTKLQQCARPVYLHPLFLFWKHGSVCDPVKKRSKIWVAKSRLQKNRVISQTSNIAFLTDSAETVDLDFGLIHQNISFKKASFHY